MQSSATRLTSSAMTCRWSVAGRAHKVLDGGALCAILNVKLWPANSYFAHDSSGFPFPATILRWAICSFCSQSSACHCTRRFSDFRVK